jgi:hypothetical protein
MLIRRQKGYIFIAPDDTFLLYSAQALSSNYGFAHGGKNNLL